MPKIAFIGAGSTVFAKNLMGDILSYPELADATIALHDIDARRLDLSHGVGRSVADTLGASPTFEVTADRERALDGADYAINMIQVGGYEPSTVIDFDVPKRFGLRQTIGDTLGVGGINHMAFFLTFERDAVDLYPEIRKVAAEGRVPDHNRVRYELFDRLGYFVTESSEHLAEYTPWFIKDARPDLIERFNIPLDEYLYRCQAGLASWTFVERELEAPGSHDPDELRATLEATPLMPTMVEGAVHDFAHLHEVQRSDEYGAQIIHAIETGEPPVIYGNVANRGLIDNLPDGACVEVPCLVDAHGIQPTRIGELPPQLAALMRTNVNVQELTVEALLSGNREHVYPAAMLDPHTGSELDLEQIWEMVDALIEAHGEMIPNALRNGSAS